MNEPLTAKIVETKMFPNKFHIEFQHPYKPDNAGCYFHPTVEAALDYMAKHKIELV